MSIIDHRITSRADWTAARKQLLARERQFTHERDQLAAQRRDLPWVEVTEPYAFDRARGKARLADLFDGRSQLLVYHLMFGPDWDAACKSCSFWADSFNGIPQHLAHRDVTMIAISRAPLAKLAAYRARMGWQFEWVSSHGSSFNFDYGVSFSPEQVAAGAMAYNFGTTEVKGTEMPGVSAFYRRGDGRVFHTYSCYARGIDALNGAYQYLDLVAKGRDEAGLAFPMEWVKRHDEYGA
jgi:predicted dithiol-disulfide oxidoreductase (DUF899 family)